MFICTLYSYVCIYAYRCVCIYMYIVICICTHICIDCIHRYVCMHVCMYVRLYVCMYVCMSVCMYVCMEYLPICLCIYLSICLSIYLTTCLSVYLSISLCVCPRMVTYPARMGRSFLWRQARFMRSPGITKGLSKAAADGDSGPDLGWMVNAIWVAVQRRVIFWDHAIPTMIMPEAETQ